MQAAAAAAELLQSGPMQETPVKSLDWGDPLGKGMATYSTVLAWEIP